MAELRSFIFIDRLQPQTMSYLGTWIKGALPRAIQAAQIIEVASSGDQSRKKLEQCLKSPDSERALREDIEYAMAYDIHGTPMLVVNGKEISAGGSETFLYALSLTNGNAQSPAFRALPPPRAMSAHEGHGH